MMSKHSQAKILKTYADNTELHIFLNDNEDAKWIRTNPKALMDYPECDFFACLPQHNENGQCLHWLNGGDVEFRRGDEEWQDECEKYHGWDNYCGMMNCDVEFRIKPRKERRYLYVSKEGATTYAKKTKEEAAREVSIMGGSFDVWKLHELEIEV